jgi:hypothetical protein
MKNRIILPKLLAVLPEVFDKAKCSTLRHVIAFNSLLLSEQHGFRRGMSTENTALKLTRLCFCAVTKICCMLSSG